MHAVKISDMPPKSVMSEKRAMCSSEKISDSQTGSESTLQMLAMEANVIAETGREDLSNQKPNLEQYLRSLTVLNTMASESSTAYAKISPRLKTEMALFKVIVENYQTDASYCKAQTCLYFKLWDTFHQHDPESFYDLYSNWTVILAAFTAETRADTFIDCFRQFEQIVQHLLRAENRWTKLAMLSIVLSYTQEVSSQTMRALHSASGCDFLDVIRKTMNFPSFDQATPLQTANDIVTAINSAYGSMRSFKPYKIMCDNKEYTLADFELWMDWNVSKKVISFVAMSVTTDKSKDICGCTTSKLRIVFHRNVLCVKGVWNLRSKWDNAQSCKIQFRFATTIHTMILESDLKNIFDIQPAPIRVPVAKGIAVAECIQPEMKVTHGQEQSMTFSHIDADLDVREKPAESSQPAENHGQEQTMTFSRIDADLDIREKATESTQPWENRIPGTIEPTTIRYPGSQIVQSVPVTSETQSVDVVPSFAKTSDYFTQSSGDYKKSTNKNRFGKTLAKRRNDQMGGHPLDLQCMKPYRKRIRTESLEKCLLATKISGTTAAPMSVEQQYPRPPVKKVPAMKADHPQNPENGKNVDGLIPASDNVIPIQALVNITHSKAKNIQNVEENFTKRHQAEESNGIKAKESTGITAVVSNKPKTDQNVRYESQECKGPMQRSSNSIAERKNPQTFSGNVWNASWIIQKYFKDEEPCPIDDDDFFTENHQNENDDLLYADVHFGSVSNPDIHPLYH